MKTLLLDNSLKLIPMTSKLYHKEKINYVTDPMMCDTPYVYDRINAQKEYDKRVNDKNRRWFAIVKDTTVIGDVYFKNINLMSKSATLSIALTQDCYKGKGYSTSIIKKMIDYGINDLHLTSIYADAVLRNVRSQHVLEKVGFKYINEDNYLKYYEYK